MIVSLTILFAVAVNDWRNSTNRIKKVKDHLKRMDDEK